MAASPSGPVCAYSLSVCSCNSEYHRHLESSEVFQTGVCASVSLIGLPGADRTCSMMDEIKDLFASEVRVLSLCQG